MIGFIGKTDMYWEVEEDVEIEITDKMKRASIKDCVGNVYPYVLVNKQKLYLEQEIEPYDD